MIAVPELALTESETQYFIDLYYKLNPDNTPEAMPHWSVSNIAKDDLDLSNSFFKKLKSFYKEMKLQVSGFSFQIMWAGKSEQLFIHKDCIGEPLIPIRLSWHLIGPKIPLKWYNEIQDEPGVFKTNGKYGAWIVLNQERYEREAKVLEIVPDYPCLLNTHDWHTIAQDKIDKEGLRVILSVAFQQDEKLTEAELWNSVRDKLGV